MRFLSERHWARTLPERRGRGTIRVSSEAERGKGLLRDARGEFAKRKCPLSFRHFFSGTLGCCFELSQVPMVEDLLKRRIACVAFSLVGEKAAVDVLGGFFNFYY